jgi:hypothetical protein
VSPRLPLGYEAISLSESGEIVEHGEPTHIKATPASPAGEVRIVAITDAKVLLEMSAAAKEENIGRKQIVAALKMSRTKLQNTTDAEKPLQHARLPPPASMSRS